MGTPNTYVWVNKNVNKIQYKKIKLLLILNYFFRNVNEKKNTKNILKKHKTSRTIISLIIFGVALALIWLTVPSIGAFSNTFRWKKYDALAKNIVAQSNGKLTKSQALDRIDKMFRARLQADATLGAGAEIASSIAESHNNY